MFHVQRFSRKIRKRLNSGCIQVGNLYGWRQLWEGGLLFLVFFLCLLNLHHVYDLLITKYSNDKKEKLSSALHLYLS